MQDILRIEIVVDSVHASRVIGLLKEQGLDGYTVIRGATGAGERGLRLGDEIGRGSNNHYLLTTCAPAKLDALTEKLRPLLARYGGICLVSEARWLRH